MKTVYNTQEPYGFDEGYKQRKPYRSFNPPGTVLGGRAPGFQNIWQIIGQGIAIYGLVTFSVWAYRNQLSPYYRDSVRPYFIRYGDYLKKEWDQRNDGNKYSIAPVAKPIPKDL
ncbi:kcnma1 [Acrasis kona]|uniref:Kcnma1 n=1 Tax=Acrasis kona TaxID=1008807 RepID=A0AAW2YRH6_9EUKA